MPRKRKITKKATVKRARKVTTRKSTKKVVRTRKQNTSVSALRQRIQSIRWTESYTSLLMGVVVVIVAVLFVVSVIKQTHHIQDTSSTSTVAVTTVTPSTGSGSVMPSSELKPAQKSYTVQAGDDLWHIAEKFYKSGYNWVDIARANNLSDPSTIFSGNVLIIPNVTPQPTTLAAAPTPVQEGSNTSIKGNSYTVQPGDDLWHIAVRAYADGYQWTKIAQANNLTDPSLIFSGNVLQIPR